MSVMHSQFKRGLYSSGLAALLFVYSGERSAADAQFSGARGGGNGMNGPVGTAFPVPQARSISSNRNYLGYNGTQGSVPQFTGQASNGLNGFLAGGGFTVGLGAGTTGPYNGGLSTYGGASTSFSTALLQRWRVDRSDATSSVSGREIPLACFADTHMNSNVLLPDGT